MSSDDKPIGPTKERLRHAGEDVEEPAREYGRIAFRVNAVLDRLRSKGAINDDQYNAGNQIYSDWYLSGLSGSGAIDPSRDVVDGGKMETVTDVRLSAMDRYNRAIKRLSPIHLEAITNVVLLEIESLAEFGGRLHRYRDRADAQVSGASTLRDALSTLDFYYYGRRNTPTRASHVDGYRPSIQPSEDE